MPKAEDHPLIAFAGTYGDPLFDYLNAFVALDRLETLLLDLDAVAGLLEANCPESRRWAPWVGAEAISFYAVGYVTCLEWHAKSRLVDLLNFKPPAIRVTDVQKTITDKLVVQMVAKQASVTQLVGAALKIGSLDVYFSVIGRVFDELGVPCGVRDWLTGEAPEATACWIRAEDFRHLCHLFDFRHGLVHELGIRTMGHPNVRESWTPEEARFNGRLVASLMTGIEAAFTRYAPALFPNLLTQDRLPIGQADVLRRELERLDSVSEAAIDQLDGDDQWTRPAWAAARAAFASYAEAEDRFIDVAAMLHWRYFDARTPLRARLLRYRIDFLKELLSHFAEIGDGESVSGEEANTNGEGAGNEQGHD